MTIGPTIKPLAPKVSSSSNVAINFTSRCNSCTLFLTPCCKELFYPPFPSILGPNVPLGSCALVWARGELLGDILPLSRGIAVVGLPLPPKLSPYMPGVALSHFP